MPLTLECACPDPGVYICETVSLKWRITQVDNPDSVVTSLHLIGPTTISRGSGYLNPLIVETIDLTPVDDWLAAWGSLQMEFIGDRSIPSDDLQTILAKYDFVSRFECSDGISTLYAREQVIIPTAFSEDVCLDPSDLLINSAGRITTVGAAGMFRHSRPLNPCTGWDVTGPLDLYWTPTSLHVVDAASSTAQICLCASGGTAPYIYGIADGRLPDGITLNPDTGCLEGTVTGSAPSQSVTIIFNVVDNNGDIAEVTCVFLFCPVGSEIFGNEMI